MADDVTDITEDDDSEDSEDNGDVAVEDGDSGFLSGASTLLTSAAALAGPAASIVKAITGTSAPSGTMIKATPVKTALGKISTSTWIIVGAGTALVVLLILRKRAKGKK